MFVKSDAIIVGRRPFSNTSLIFRCVTARAGHFTVMAKGAFRRRRKAEPPSVPDLFERGEVVLYVRPYRDFAILGEWSLERPRPGIRRSYEALRAASGCAVIAEGLGRYGGADGHLFGPLDRTLTEMDRVASVTLGDDALYLSRAGGRPRPALWAFAFQALARAGFLAPLDRCAACGAEFGRASSPRPEGPGVTGRASRSRHRGPDAAGLSPGAGGIVCEPCRDSPPPEEHGDAFAALPPEAAAAARFLCGSPPMAASRLKVSARAAAALERAVRMLAEYHLERPMPVLSPGEGTAFHRQGAKTAKNG